MQDKVQISDVCEASVTRGASHNEATSISGYYTVECFNNGQLKWKDDIHNVVTTVGKNFTMDTTLGNTAGGAVVMGLKGTGTAVVADTQASHASWL
jgi:formate/nitrite transporter FocA (FNT family)